MLTSANQIRAFNITNEDNRVKAMCKQHNADAFLVASRSGDDTCIDLFNAEQPDPIETMTIEGKNVNCLTSVGGNRFVVSYEYTFTADLWDISSKQRLHTFEGHTDEINDIVIYQSKGRSQQQQMIKLEGVAHS